MWCRGHAEYKNNWQHAAAFSSKFYPSKLVLHTAAILSLSYSIASHSTATIQWLSQWLWVAFLTTNSGLLFLPIHRETAVSLPQGFLFFDTYFVQAVFQAVADAPSQLCCCFLVLKPGRLQHPLSCISCKSALNTHRSDDLTFCVNFSILRKN